jgi:hypothetical protein
MRSLASRSVGQAFEDGAVQVGARVHVAKADDGALGLGAGHLDAGVPEGLQHQALRARRHGVHQLVEQALGRHAALSRQQLLVLAELLLEPAHHPEARVICTSVL